MKMQTYFPGTKVSISDNRLYINDRETPQSKIKHIATVIKWYGEIKIPSFEDRHKIPKSWGGLSYEKVKQIWTYPSLIDIQWDRDGYISKGHFAEDIYVKVLENA